MSYPEAESNAGATRASAARDAERRFEAVFQTARDAIIVYAPDGTIVEVNPAACEMYGYTREEMIGISAPAAVHPEARAHFEEFRRVTVSGGEFRCQTLDRRRDGTAFPIEVVGTSFSYGGGPHLMAVVRDITERSRADEQLRRSHHTFYHLIQNNPFGVYVVDADFKLRQNSLGAQKVFASVSPPLLGRDFAEVLRSVWAEPFATEAIDIFRRTLQTGDPFESPRTVERRQGTGAVEAYDWRIERITLPDGRFGVVCYFYDLSERQQFEAALRQSDERLRMALGAARMVVWEFDPATGTAVVSDNAADLYGLPPGHTLESSEQGFALVHPDDVKQHRGMFARAAGEGVGYVSHFRMVRQDGSGDIVWVEERAHAVRDEAGRVVRLIGVQIDITERKRTEARDQLLMALDDAVRSMTDPDEVTATGARLLGEHLGADRCAYADVEADEDMFNLSGNYNRTGMPSIVGRYRFADFGAEVLNLMRAGKPYVVEDIDTHHPRVADLTYYRQTLIQAVVCVPLLKGGRFVAAMAVHQRVARRWTAEEVELVLAVAARCWESIERGRVLRVLRQSEAQFRQLADAMPQMVWVTRPDGYHEYFNRRWYEFTGAAEGSTDGEGWNEMFHPDDRAPAWAIWRRSLATGEAYEIEYRLRHHSGEYRWTLGRALPIRGADGAVVRWFGTCTDIDALKTLQNEREELLAREREARAEAERASEAKSEFLATLSHELRTPLTPVMLTISLLENHAALADELREDVATIRRNVELESRLISDLLDLTRIERGKLQLDQQDVDLHLLVRSSIDICQREASAKLVTDYRAAKHVVHGDGTRLQQVFWNLINNAIKFTPEGGSITVRSLNTEGGGIRVEVSDTGAGIDSAVLPRLFAAFEQGEIRAARQQAGLGLGLAISKRLVEMHGGTITASSAGRGKGASFTVDLPTVDVFVVPPVAQPSRGYAAVAPLRVLLVEDHEPTVNVMTRLLRGSGHHVTGVSTAALAVTAARQGGFDVMICDLGLPDGSGLDVMRQVRDRFEGRAVALTGYGMEGDIAASRAAGFADHLTKPVDLAALEAAIARLVVDSK